MTTRPQPCPIMSLAAARVKRNGASRLIPIVLHHVSFGISATEASSADPPALLTRISTGPRSRRVSSMATEHPSSLERSQTT